MKKIILVLACVGLLLAGCEKSDLSLPGVDENLKSAKMIERDLKMFNLNAYFYSEPAPEGCCLPDGIYGIIIGEGNSNHLGKFTLYERYCVNESGFPLSFDEGYFTAANGDKIFYSMTGAGINEEGINFSEFVIFGGTGRFENAEGEFVNCYVSDPENQTITAEITGTITY
jgi:hypothetical protein